METIDIVIRIPKKKLERLQEIANGTWGVANLNPTEIAILNGTVLPKEHGGMSKDAEHIIKLIAKYFEPPCMYEYGDVDAFDFINKIDETEGINWCEEHCGSVSPCECWKRFFELMAKAEKEQMEEQNVN